MRGPFSSSPSGEGDDHILRTGFGHLTLEAGMKKVEVSTHMEEISSAASFSSQKERKGEKKREKKKERKREKEGERK